MPLSDSDTFQFWHFPILTLSVSDSFQSLHIPISIKKCKKCIRTLSNPPFFQMSQAAILFEGAKYVKLINKETEKLGDDIKAVNKEIEDLNNEIE